VRIGAQKPRVDQYPPYVSSAGQEAIDLAAVAGLYLDPWQQHVLTHSLGERGDGKWSAPKVSMWVPRQNGKGGVLEARELWGLFLGRERLILHSAHEYKTAQEAFLRIRGLIEGSAYLSKRVMRVWQANGEQGIELTRAAGGGRLRFVARSKNSGRGFSGDCVVLDEGQALTAEIMAAMLPTLSARPNHQMWICGTPPDDPAAWCYGVREDGEAGAPRLAHFDWGQDVNLADPAAVRAAVADRKRWYAANPSLGIRIAEETVEDELKPSGLGPTVVFAMERLGAWLPRAGDGPKVLDIKAWERLMDAESALVLSTGLALSVDITPSRDSSCIGLYGLREDGRGHAEIIDQRPGTSWLVERLEELRDRWNPVAIALDAAGPAVTLIEPLGKLAEPITVPDDPEKPEYGDLYIPTARDVAAACGQLADAVRDAELAHIGQQILSDAIRGAATRPLGDAWAWARRISSVDISPLVNITLARRAYLARAHLVEQDYDVADSFG
jgi:phage terminase large subunit-like protein